ncbi:hypothetical protein QLH51_00770 [Sphingomonas sp. 2R-10]|uniref:hypothetical protein n=1 Tax=Sphingomonas sp. 2R-10 TaxID=3045148 RepID=UPI000F7ACB75|nr:hypothetical protein [Sphingomonas sp. 2R-10]MDJ0275338.1 hypothetical protein [Sphingomonas sp. 2R-10]
MNKIRCAASIVLGIGTATAALAAEPQGAATPVDAASTAAVPTTITLAAGAAATAYKAPANARYCFRTEHPGWFIRRTVCKTRTDWQASGVDLKAALAGR